MTMDDIDLQWLAIGNALIQPLYRAKVAADLKLRTDWARFQHNPAALHDGRSIL